MVVDAMKAREGAHAVGLRDPVEHVAAVLYGGELTKDAAVTIAESAATATDFTIAKPTTAVDA